MTERLEFSMSDRRIAWLLLGGFVALYLCTSGAEGPALYDGGVMLDTARRIWDHGFAPVPGKANHDSFSKYGLGQVLLDLPFAGLANFKETQHGPARVMVSLALALLPALTSSLYVMLVFLCARRMRLHQPSATAIAVLTGTTSMVWAYSQNNFSDPTVGLCWLASFYFLLRFRDSSRRKWLGFAGFAAGYALLVKATGGVAMPVLGLYGLHAAWRHGRRHRALIADAGSFIAPIVLIVMVLLWYNDLRYGSPFNFGYANPNDRDGELGFSTPLLVGLFGLLLGSGKGFFFYNPTAILGLLGCRRSFRRMPVETVVLVVLPALMVLSHVKWWAWHGDWAWGPRFLAGAPGFLLLLAGPTLQWVGNETRKGLGQAVRIWSLVVISALGMVVQCEGLAFRPDSFIILTTTQVQPMAHGYFSRDSYPIRDDGIHLHFLPEFSPIAGHLWMARCIRHKKSADGSAWKACMANPPWLGLNAKWTLNPDNAKREFKLRAWFLVAMEESDPNLGWYLALAVGLALAAVVQLALAWRQARAPLSS